MKIKMLFIINFLILIFLNSASPQEPNQYYFKDIKFDIFTHRDYNPGELVNEEILKFLFPGNIYQTEYYFLELETYELSCWTSSGTEKNDFSFTVDDNPKYFPMETNCTFMTKKIAFINSNGKHIFYFFNTNEDGEPTVRFRGGFIGIAKFKNENNLFTLKIFNPAVDYFGHWNFAPHPKEILDLGNGNYGIFYDYLGEGMQMEDYDPYFGYMRLYSEIEEKFVCVFFEDKSLCKNWEDSFGTEWYSKIKVLDNSSHNNFYDIQIITDGNFDNKNYPEGFEKNFPTEKINESFNFKIIKTYIYNGSEYIINNEEVLIF